MENGEIMWEVFSEETNMKSLDRGLRMIRLILLSILSRS
jgi:hypothetical protein